MSKEIRVSRIVFMMKLFLQMLCEKILIFFKIMLEHCSQLSELNCFEFLDIFYTLEGVRAWFALFGFKI